MNKRSKSAKKEIVSLEEVKEFWKNLANSVPRKTRKSSLELLREDKESH